jgi:hypothetical protein
MPNFDAGHYFLTVLAPLRADPVVRDKQSHSRRHLIKEVLAGLPTAERTVASKGKDNPFARCRRTHFARLALLDDVVFNGRTPRDSLVRSLEGIDPIVPQTVDSLSTPFLIFVADFDAEDGSDHALRAITDDLWATMQYELVEIFQHCWGFDATAGADGFFKHIKKCQVETTMPFNDYWFAPPAFPIFDIKPYLAGALLAIVLFVLGLSHGHHWLLPVSLVVLALDVFFGVRGLLAAGEAPFPRSAADDPQSDLPTVLKALSLQRAFTDFAIDTQGLLGNDGDDTALYDQFAAFLAANTPKDVDTATQTPGVIGVPTGALSV